MKRFLVLLVVLLSIMLPLGGAAAQSNYTVTVSGVGISSTLAEITILRFGIERVGTNLITMQNSINGAVEQLREALNEVPIPEENIDTSGIEVSVENWLDGENALTGVFVNRMRVSIQVRVLDPLLVQPTISAAVESGVNIIEPPTYATEEILELRDSAQISAIADANARARAIAWAAGLAVGDPLVIREIEVVTNIPNDVLPITRDEILEAEPREVFVRVQVEVTYSLRLAGSSG